MSTQTTQATLQRTCGLNRDELVLNHLDLVKRVAQHMKNKVPNYMQTDDLIQVGTLGLIEAAQTFDFSQGAEFESYAYGRIRGAMLDEVRRFSDLPRSAVSFHKLRQRAEHVLLGELGRLPTSGEIAQHMGQSVQDFHQDWSKALRFEMRSIETETDDVMVLPDDPMNRPDVQYEEAQFMAAVVEQIKGLPERHQLVMQLYYVEALNLSEISQVLGVTVARVSQILSASVKQLRAALKISVQDKKWARP